MEQELILSYTTLREATEAIENYSRQGFLFLRHNVRTRQLFFKKPINPPSLIQEVTDE